MARRFAGGGRDMEEDLPGSATGESASSQGDFGGRGGGFIPAQPTYRERSDGGSSTGSMAPRSSNTLDSNLQRQRPEISVPDEPQASKNAQRRQPEGPLGMGSMTSALPSYGPSSQTFRGQGSQPRVPQGGPGMHQGQMDSPFAVQPPLEQAHGYGTPFFSQFTSPQPIVHDIVSGPSQQLPHQFGQQGRAGPTGPPPQSFSNPPFFPGQPQQPPQNAFPSARLGQMGGPLRPNLQGLSPQA
jgi:hypothetical protein